MEFIATGEEERVSEEEICMIANDIREERYWQLVNDSSFLAPKDRDPYDRRVLEEYCKVRARTIISPLRINSEKIW
jgi:hypothetical protein